MPRFGLTSVFFPNPTAAQWQSAADAGFRYVEICYRDALYMEHMLQAGDAVHRIAVQAGMTAATAHLPYLHAWDVSSANMAERLEAISMQERLLRHVADLGIPLAVLHPSFEPIDETERPARLKLSADAISRLGTLAKKLGVVLAVENLPRTCLGNCAEEILFLTDNGRSAKVCMDANHLLLETHEAFIRAAGEHIVHLHMSDYDGNDEKHWLPGQGIVDWPGLKALLEGVGFDGIWMLEVREATALPGQIITPAQAMQRLRTTIGEALA